ncbi:MAG: class I SAM-dependent methyltransferase [Alphaproteobacteria bacterium]|nr:class I SAM-dependent methyltransferase [Alphaproteobacteria bacterium]
MAGRSIFQRVTLGIDKEPARSASSAATADPRPDYHGIITHYERCLAEHGPNHRGVDWPNAPDLATRFDVMLGVVRATPARPSVLDLGCGPGLLLDHLRATGRQDALDYNGVDLSQAMIEAGTRLWPSVQFSRRDILEQPFDEKSFDYVIMNGVLTEKESLSAAAMTAYAERLIEAAFRCCRVGIAFNVMSAHVDRKRDDLFHWPFDALMSFLKARVTRHVTLRADYGLYEYTVYAYRTASSPAG